MISLTKGEAEGMIAAARKLLGLNQAELAEQVGLPSPTVSDIEAGKAPRKTSSISIKKVLSSKDVVYNSSKGIVSVMIASKIRRS